MIAITGATGQLGRKVIHQLLKTLPASELIALVRDPAAAAPQLPAGITLREADYNRAETLAPALKGAEKLLFISSSEIGQREVQHGAVIDAAKQAGVKFIAYTSLLHADSSPLGLAAEHRATEALLARSGIDYALLRNGWYSENYAASIAPALSHHAFIGAAGEGKISSASRQDYAEAAAKVITDDNQAGKVYELAGDESWTLQQFSAEIARQSGVAVEYVNLTADAFAAALKQAGLPDALADLLADSDAGAAQGGLFDDSHTLSTLIGRPATPFRQTISDTLK
ncbi:MULTISPECIES: SDR family oxidoreductase [Tatumella]|uniref:SDR family oxidoreductase n=1 Tax=Tatumella punctata TaxID=399969 RepID=A0ABW1VN90_9GAMM|nr:MULTISPECIES: SDR family oxidoreductase [unclassified Tatumella]MBS0878272.1 SDR family oxidoreductase [Tatumella sp. JGM82]MBS0891761.1 SDR family oxidoreductase [Tatumella sp. JGM94]MBS0902986.1 SDR family oxidoreductase [Tatumella sp. JGM100]